MPQLLQCALIKICVWRTRFVGLASEQRACRAPAARARATNAPQLLVIALRALVLPQKLAVRLGAMQRLVLHACVLLGAAALPFGAHVRRACFLEGLLTNLTVCQVSWETKFLRSTLSLICTSQRQEFGGKTLGLVQRSF